MKATPILLAAIATTLTLAGCGSDSEKKSTVDRSLVPDAVISGFSVTGTAPAQDQVTPINAGVDGGKFTIDWNITAANSFQMKLYLSHDDVRSDDDLQLFNNGVCGAVRINDCNAQDQYVCHFGTDNMLNCSDGWETFSQNIYTQGFLTGLPQQAFVIGEACVPGDCNAAAVKIEFQ